MTTAWLEKAFVELAGKDSIEAQDVLRRWVASRLLTMADYHALADRLTAAYLDRDTRRARNLEHARGTGKLPLAPGKGGKPARPPAATTKPPAPPPATGPLARLEALRGRKPGWRQR